MQSGFDLSIVIGGDAGQGVETSGSLFSLALARAGLHVFAATDYRSRIRGGHNFYQIRVADHPIYAHSDPVHLVLALSKESADIHLENIAPGGGVLCDSTYPIDAEKYAERQISPLILPLTEIAESCGNKIMMNTAIQAAAAGLLGLPLEYLESVIKERYARKGEKVVAGNLAAAKQAYDQAATQLKSRITYQLHALPDAPQRLLINGNEALALGAAAGGCRFIAAYPMTPATTIFEWFITHASKMNMVAKQAEDEIASVLMAAGAAFSGARAMTATSGGGFNLMTETLGMAGMCEVPLVVVNVQRGGPSTGLPTRTEQSDLLFALHPSHGEFPHLVLAPSTIEECFTAGWRAFNLAEKYQCPVVILSDTYLASSLRTVEWDSLNMANVRWDRGLLLSNAELAQQPDYARYAFTADGISPRAIPGQQGGVHAPATDEHTPDAHICEEISNRNHMMQKRMRKLDIAARDLIGPELLGPPQADVTLITWGSLLGAVVEACNILAHQGVSANVVHMRDLWPFPAQATRALLVQALRLVAVEQNYTGQLAQLIRMATGIQVDHLITKYDGRSITPIQIANTIAHQLSPTPGNSNYYSFI